MALTILCAAEELAAERTAGKRKEVPPKAQPRALMSLSVTCLQTLPGTCCYQPKARYDKLFALFSFKYFVAKL